MGCSFGDHLPIKRKQGLPEYITCILFGHLNPQIIKNTKNQNYHSHHCYIFEKLRDPNGSSRMSNMTFPCVNSIQLVPTMEKRISMSSFLAKFLKMRSTKVTATSLFLCGSKKKNSQYQRVPESKSHTGPHLYHPENAPK